MQKFFIFFSFSVFVSFSQTIKDCRQRFDNYLNFKGSLNNLVKFEENAIFILNARGEKELAIYEHELNALADFFEHSSLKQQEQLLRLKGTKRYSSRQRDSLLIYIDDRKSTPSGNPKQPLAGYKIAIDPGHFSTTLKDAQIEQKYLYFVKDSIANPLDTVKLFESELTFNTAKHLQTMLEGQGAKVFVTRKKNNYTSFNCTYDDWIRNHKARMLDSLQKNKLINAVRYKELMQMKEYKLFWDFFRDFDLLNRAQKINQFDPHLSIVIHFNVDEQNEPWNKHSDKNFTMAFIGGAFTADNLAKTEGRINFLRLLLTNQLNRSEKLASETVDRFSKNLKIPVASQYDAVYLRDNCMMTRSPGVFSRNLILCRKINSPLVYGESLYQDNENESKELMRSDLDVFGIKSNMRLSLVARSYYEAVMAFLKVK
ncbi:MAG: N-acetylmuramoyl-L-alanine amidase [Bacteroidota bacterium]